MSELTLCNRCTLDAMKRRAKKAGEKVVLRKSVTYGGTNVSIIRKGGEREFVAWFQALTESCVC